MTLRCSVHSILVRFSKLALLALAAVWLVPAQTIETLARAWRDDASPSTRQALARFATAHPKDIHGALALLALGETDLEEGRFAQARENLKAAQPRVTKLADLIAFWLARTAEGEQDYARAIAELEPVWNASPPSPWVGRAALLAARAHLELDAPRSAVDVLRRHASQLPQPAGDLQLARSLEAAGDSEAATVYQRVYYDYPLSAEARDAEPALDRLSPPVQPKGLLTRAEKLIRAGETTRVRRELDRAIPRLSGADRDVANVRIGAALYGAKDNAGALRHLRSLEVDGEADAERLYYIYVAARRLERESDMSDALDQLAKRHRSSRWRLETLLAAGNRHLLENRAEQYEPIYRACYESFPSEQQAAYCHWKTVWAAWMRRGSGADALLREHLERYPASEKANSALYFLGRLAQERGDVAEARGWFEEITRRYPNSYYAMLAREKLTDARIRTASPTPDVATFLATVRFPTREHAVAGEAGQLTSVRIERARLLTQAALDEWAEQELRYGAKNGGDAALMAMELAEVAQRRGAPDRGIRYIKGIVPTYLFTPFDKAGDRFWQLAFPLPYRQPLERYAEQRSLDPFLVAGLIRQESEFNPRAVSRANAIGLTQIRPGTGREISRKDGLRGFTVKTLYQPEVNLRLGTYYLRTLLNSLSGNWEATLAAYNAGKSRADLWLNWGPFREPAEFVETVPLTETRDYIQSVLRNADFYRRLYAGRTASISSVETPKPEKKASNGSARKNVRKSSGKSKRSAAISKRPYRAFR